MPTITWKGEQGVKEVEYGGHVFVAGEAVTTDDEKLLAACNHSGAFEVKGYTPTETPKPSAAVVPPSQQSAQGPSPKPGELVGSLPSGQKSKS